MNRHFLAWLTACLLLTCPLAAAEPPLSDGSYLILGQLSKAPPPGSVPDRARYLRYDYGVISGGPSEIQHLLVHSQPDVPLVLAGKPELSRDAAGKPKLQLQLDPRYAMLLESFTRSHVMNRVLLVAGGVPLTIHKIREPITGGKFQLTRCTDFACEKVYVELMKRP